MGIYIYEMGWSNSLEYPVSVVEVLKAVVSWAGWGRLDVLWWVKTLLLIMGGYSGL